jgi:hypothetical protein
MSKLITNYKYRTYKAALRDLQEGSVYFALHSQFHAKNDWLEGKFVMETSGSTFSKAVVDGLNEIMIKRGSLNRFGINSIPGFDNMVSNENKIFIDQINTLGIFSTSGSYLNQAMWVHYCENEGVCFELEWNEELIAERNLKIQKVAYSDDPRIVNREIIYKNLLIELGVNNPSWSVRKILDFSLSVEFRKRWRDEFIIKCSTVKRSCWEYEDEIRILSPKSQVFSILKNILKSVYIFIPKFIDPNFKVEIDKSPNLREIWVQLVDKYPDVKLFGLSFDNSGQLNKEEIKLRKYH